VNHLQPDFSDILLRVVRLLKQPLTTSTPGVRIRDARNRSAHPLEEENVAWADFVGAPKESLGKPPAELLRLLVGLTAASCAT